VTGGGQTDSAALERAARQLEALAQQLTRIAQDTQHYQHRVAPISERLGQLVGGSATGRDQRIASMLQGATAEIKRSADSCLEAAHSAQRAAAGAQQRALEARRGQQDQRARP